MSRLVSAAGRPDGPPPQDQGGDAHQEQQQRDSTDTQKQMDFSVIHQQNNNQRLNYSQLNNMPQKQDLNQSIQSLNQSVQLQKLQNQVLLERIQRNKQMLQPLRRMDLNDSMASQGPRAPLLGLGGLPAAQRRPSDSAPWPSGEQVAGQLTFLKTVKQQCEHLKRRISLEVKQKLKFLVLNSIHVKQVKALQDQAVELDKILKDIRGEGDGGADGKEMIMLKR